MNKRLLLRLHQTEKDPSLALTRGWHRDPEFLAGLCDRCEHLGYAGRSAALELAKHAVRFAERLGDPHLIHRSHGVLSFACIGVWDLFWAGKALDVVRPGALACCPRCRSDFLFRQADLLGEERRGEETLRALAGSIEEGGGELGREELGKRLLLRSIGHHWTGHRAAAVADAGRVVCELPLSAPRDQFTNAISFLAVWVAGGDPSDDLAALAHLEAFEARLKNAQGWTYERTRLAWARGQLCGRCGDIRAARRNLERVYRRLLADGLPREAVAAAVDVAQLLCRHPEPWGDNPDVARRVLDRCLTRRADLSEEQRRGLEEMKQVLEVSPQSAFSELVAFRGSFIAPVPGVMAERLRGG